MSIARRHGLRVVEDAAQGVNAWYHGRALGSIGHLAAYSFHETKNYICGEGGALCINDRRFIQRAEILRDKGTNRKQFFRGEGPDAIGIGLKIVEQADSLESQFRLDFGCVNTPRQIRHLDRAVLHRTGHAKTGMPHMMGIAFAQEKTDDFHQRLVVFTWKRSAFLEAKLVVLVRVKGQVRFRAANVACEKHEGSLKRNRTNVEPEM